jgi:hypothetical protein
VDDLIDKETPFFFSHKLSWSLTTRPQTLEVTAHALRVILALGKVQELADEFLALVTCQHEDGGWSSYATDPTSTTWVSAFCSLMLVRGNQRLGDERIARALHRSIDYFLATQKDGRWTDGPTWSDLDATSHPVSFLHVVQILREGYRRAEVRTAWRKGLRFLLDHQSQDGAWYDPDVQPPGPVVASGSPVEMAAHLVQDSFIADLMIDNLFGVREASAKATRWLREHQAENGSWDGENVDHTMDATRALMVVSKVLGEQENEAVIHKAMRWIIRNKNDRGWGDFPGEETNIERTCDGLDTLLKYRAYGDPDLKAFLRLWGYTPG